LGLPARQHTVEWIGTPDKAVDGDTNGDFVSGKKCMHTLETDNPWWAVDLGSTRTIGSVNIYNRVECKFVFPRA